MFSYIQHFLELQISLRISSVSQVHLFKHKLKFLFSVHVERGLILSHLLP